MSAQDAIRAGGLGLQRTLKGRGSKGTGKPESSPRQKRGSWQAVETRGGQMYSNPTAQRRHERRPS